MFQTHNQRNHAKHLLGLTLVLAGLAISLALPVYSSGRAARLATVTLANHSIQLGQAGPKSNSISSASSQITCACSSLTIVESQALAKSIFVNAAANQNGDGSAENPYRRITDAVERARATRQTSDKKIIIHVARGVYVGSYDAARLASNPNLEVLPIILNVPQLVLRGGTVLDEDSLGLPTGTDAESETIITADRALGLGQSLLLIAPTTDGMDGNRVTVAGFVLDAISGNSNLRGRGIIVERVSDFAIRRNVIRHTYTGLQTRLASGVIEANLFLSNYANGVGIEGGSIVDPAQVTVRANRATQNLEGLILGVVANTFPLQLGANTLAVMPLQTTFDRNNAHDQNNIPDRLDATVIANDFSNNRSGGLRCFFLSPQFYNTQDETQPITGTIIATIGDNSFNGNGDYGIIVDAGFPFRNTPRQFTGVFIATFENNDLAGNGRAPAFFGFTRVFVSLGNAPRALFKYLQQSSFDVTDEDGEFAVFDFDNPTIDPFDGAELLNTLTINGTTYVGRKVTP